MRTQGVRERAEPSRPRRKAFGPEGGARRMTGSGFRANPPEMSE